LGDAAQCVAADRDEATTRLRLERCGKACRHSKSCSTDRLIARMRLTSLTAGPMTVKSRRSLLPTLP
jgi:hypothetical protein